MAKLFRNVLVRIRKWKIYLPHSRRVTSGKIQSIHFVKVIWLRILHLVDVREARRKPSSSKFCWRCSRPCPQLSLTFDRMPEKSPRMSSQTFVGVQKPHFLEVCHNRWTQIRRSVLRVLSEIHYRL